MLHFSFKIQIINTDLLLKQLTIISSLKHHFMIAHTMYKIKDIML